MNDPETMSEQPERMRGREKHPGRKFIIWICITVGAWVLIARCGDIVIAAPDNASETYTVTAGDPASIHGFLILLGAIRIAPPAAVQMHCLRQYTIPLGVYQNPEGKQAIICVDPNEKMDPDACASYDLERIVWSEKSITCRRKSA